MRTNRAIIFIAIVFVCFLAPIGAQQSSNTKTATHRANNKPVTTPTPVPVITTKGPPLENARIEEQPKREQYVFKLTAPEKTPTEWVSFLVNIAVAGFVIWGVFVANHTLRSVHGQLIEMRRQRNTMQHTLMVMEKEVKLLESQIEQTGKIANQTLVLQFRPKLALRGWYVDDNKILIIIVNVGGSPAKLVDFYIRCSEEKADLNNPLAWEDKNRFESVPTLQPGSNTVYLFTPDEASIKAINAQMLATKQMPAQAFTSKVRIAGVVFYEDDLSIRRVANFSRVFIPQAGYFIAPHSDGNEED